MSDVTRILSAIEQGDPQASEPRWPTSRTSCPPSSKATRTPPSSSYRSSTRSCASSEAGPCLATGRAGRRRTV